MLPYPSWPSVLPPLPCSAVSEPLHCLWQTVHPTHAAGSAETAFCFSVFGSSAADNPTPISAVRSTKSNLTISTPNERFGWATARNSTHHLHPYPHRHLDRPLLQCWLCKFLVNSLPCLSTVGFRSVSSRGLKVAVAPPRRNAEKDDGRGCGFSTVHLRQEEDSERWGDITPAHSPSSYPLRDPETPHYPLLRHLHPFAPQLSA